MDTQASSDPVRELLANLKKARDKLINTGSRNRLINVNRKNTRSNVINVANERSNDVFRILKNDRKTMKFWATGTDKESGEAKPNDEEGVQDDEGVQYVLLERIDTLNEEPDEARYTDNRLETKLGPDAQQKRLLKMFRDAKTAEEEQGINILYLALGFLRWFENDNSEIEREAPLILLPVDLVRNQRTSTYDLVVRDDEIATNLPLRERFSQDFGLKIPETKDADSDEWTPGGYFDEVEQAISSKDRWSVDRDGMQLGFFSFSKFLMLRDLIPDNWPTGKLLDSTLLSSLLLSTFEGDSPLFGDKDNLDNRLDPSEMFHVLDADRSQTIVIEEVRKGRNLVVQGPPGTGKSQTIANIIAAAVHDGKRVLFVAEKMAALSVVHNRLKKTGLEHVALELHSKAANKRHVLEELGRTLNEGKIVSNAKDDPDSVRNLRDLLNGVDKILHSPLPNTDLTAFQAMAIMAAMKGRSVPAPSMDGSPLVSLQEDRIEALCVDIEEFGNLLHTDQTNKQNPFRGTGNLDLQPLDLQRTAEEARSISKLANELSSRGEEIRSDLGFEEDCIAAANTTCDVMKYMAAAPENTAVLVPNLFDEAENTAFVSLLGSAIAWKEAESGTPFVDAALSVPAGEIRASLSLGSGSFFRRLGAKYRSASNVLSTLIKSDLPKRVEDRIALADRLIEFQNLYHQYSENRPVLEKKLGDEWAGDATDFGAINRVLEFVIGFRKLAPNASGKTLAVFANNAQRDDDLVSRLSTTSQQLAEYLRSIAEKINLDFQAAFGVSKLEAISLKELEQRFGKIDVEQRRYDDWCKYRKLRSALSGSAVENLAERMEEGSLTASGASDEIRYARAEAAWKIARNEQPELKKLDDLPRHQWVKEFRKTEKDRMENVRKVVASKHLDRVPSGAIGEMGFVRAQIARKRGHAPIRKLIETAGSVIQRIRPVFLMSPISVAQFLPPGSVEFDVLIIDEASQVRPEDALGAIARSKQIVVVGDQKQLPPTAFFDKMTSNTDGDDDDAPPLVGYATEAESILSLCDSRQLPSRMLSWHYRSRDPSLMKVSNVEFYKRQLVLPPSPLENDQNYGLRFIRVNGVYTPKRGVDGKPGTNIIEVEVLVDAVKRHARDMPDLSLGIATFNIAQRDCVNEVLERERRADASLDEFLREGRTEDLFVKNIENVQGDERDVIMISVGYGPRLSGQRLSSTNFGPVNNEGGHRRLNVLFSRARVRCDVFCSFDPGDIAIAGKSDGVRVFKRYLEFAKSGVIDEATATGGAPDSPFESDVATVIRDLGYSVDHQVGSAGFFIDLGVIHPNHPGRYMVAVECDGATYHSSLFSRERDRLRQEVLENLGWRFHRIWSTDWFLRREKEKDRLKNALQNAATQSNLGTSISGANKGAESADVPIDRLEHAQQQNPTALRQVRSIATPYKRAKIRCDKRTEPHLAKPSVMNRLVGEIVMQEGPIHLEGIARRYAEAFGKQRAGSRIVDVVTKTLGRLKGKTLDTVDSGSQLVSDGLFWMTEAQRLKPPIRNRSAESGTPIFKVEMLPSVELSAAAKAISEESGAVLLDELVTQVARELGYERTGSELKTVIERTAKQFASE